MKINGEFLFKTNRLFIQALKQFRCTFNMPINNE